MYFQAPLQAALQALNYAKHAMINSLIGAMVKLSVLWLLATNPNFGIDGVILSVVVGILVVTLLHFAALYLSDSIQITCFIDHSNGFSTYPLVYRWELDHHKPFFYI